MTSTCDRLVAPGDDYHIGDGDEMFSLLPIFWVDGSAPIGSTYSAEFRLDNVGSAFGGSGRFFVDVAVVPEPTLLSLGGVLLLTLRRRR